MWVFSSISFLKVVENLEGDILVLDLIVFYLKKITYVFVIWLPRVLRSCIH